MLFYTDGEIVASPKSACLQGDSDTLTGLFDRVGLRNNKLKTASIACWPYHTPPAWSMEADTWRVTGRLLLYRDRLRQRVYFPECGDGLAAGLFTAHRQRQYLFGRGGPNPPPPEGGEGGEGEDRVREGIPAQYRVSFPAILSLLRCPVEGY